MKWPFGFLRLICPAQMLEEIEGDLIQRFERDVNTFGETRAKARLIWNVIRYFRPGIVLRKKFPTVLGQGYLMRNYCHVGIRNLMKRKVYAVINIFGLALGLSVFLVIGCYVDFELSYDNFHKNEDQIFRTLFTDYKNGEKISSSPKFGYNLGPALLQDLPEIKTYVRTHGIGGDKAVMSYTRGDGTSNQFQEENILFVDSTFLDVFTCEVMRGNAQRALDDPHSIVITESVAKRYFGEDADPIGKTLQIYTQYWIKGDYVITAVIKDVPSNSHMSFEFLIPLHDLLQVEGYKEPGAGWDWVNFITYVMVRPNTDVERLNAKTPDLLTKYTGPNPPGTFVFTFQPLRSIHADEQQEDPLKSMPFFILVSIFILAIAWTNYINLSTARATERAKEVGVKKTLGVLRGQLIMQFIVESLLINLISIVLAVLLAVVLLPVLGNLVGKDLSFGLIGGEQWLVLAGLWIFGSFVSGIYPAFILSSFKTADVIKGRLGKTNNAFTFRKALVVFQFVTSLFLIAGTFVIYRQLNFMQQQEKGMNMHQIMIVDGPRIMEENGDEQQLLTFKHELMGLSNVQDVATSGSIPGAGFSLITGMTRLGAEVKPTERESIYIVRVDHDFLKTYGISLQAERPWSPAMESGNNYVLINEAVVTTFGLGNAEQALNEKLLVDDQDTVTILGVFPNVHWSSLHTAYVPMVLWLQKVSGKQFTIHLSGNIRESVAQVEQLYKKRFPGNPFNHYFLDDFFDQQYKADRQFGQIFGALSLLALVLACSGLWGLASLAISQRTKEISVRKVLGASVQNILSLLSAQFLRLLAKSCIIAFPILWFGINSWLNGFAFRIGLSWDLFVVPATLLLLLALSSVSIQTIKAAVSNPVNGLRSE